MTDNKNNLKRNKKVNLGKTLLIINPVAQSGQGKQSGEEAYKKLKETYKQDVDLLYTEKKQHAEEIAKNSSKYDTLIAVGGDGVIHEVANGLMAIKKENRPQFGIIPVGSGNDYARSLNMSFKTSKAVDQLINGRVIEADVGKCNEVYYVETLSFGLDAGIALDTMERRKKHNTKGTILYMQSGMDQLLHHLNTYNFEAELDGKPLKGSSIMFVIQIGKTYGGGFKICPDAEIDNGLLNICYAQGKLTVPRAVYVFFTAKNGHHINKKEVNFETAKTMTIKFDKTPPCQIDGEKYTADVFNVSVCAKALKVIKYFKD